MKNLILLTATLALSLSSDVTYATETHWSTTTQAYKERYASRIHSLPNVGISLSHRRAARCMDVVKRLHAVLPDITGKELSRLREKCNKKRATAARHIHHLELRQKLLIKRQDRTKQLHARNWI